MALKDVRSSLLRTAMTNKDRLIPSMLKDGSKGYVSLSANRRCAIFWSESMEIFRIVPTTMLRSLVSGLVLAELELEGSVNVTRVPL